MPIGSIPRALEPRPAAAARGVALSLIGLVTLVAAGGCDSPEQQRVRTARAIYEASCAECHGSYRKAKASEPKPSVPDLRTLQRRWGGVWEAERVAAYIDGRVVLPAHGPEAMPVWGDRFYEGWPGTESREEARAGTIRLLVDYLETVQVEEPPSP